MTRRETFEAAQESDSSVQVFWGCWTDRQLDAEIPEGEYQAIAEQLGWS